MEVLPSITRLSSSVLRILGQNPGPFTHQGTNVYLIGTRNPYTLFDTGQGMDAFIPVLRTALLEATTVPDQPAVSDIIISHKHQDHTEGLPSVLALLADLWTARTPPHPSAFVPPRIRKAPLHDTRFSALLSKLLPSSYTPSPDGSALHDLHDGQLLTCSDGHTTLKVLHTPGHTADSICLSHAADRALFTADTVISGSTSVFDDLSAYIPSLQRLLALSSSSCARLYPGHGPVVEDGPALITQYITHRLEREGHIVRILGAPAPSEEGWSVADLVQEMYAAMPESVQTFAAVGVELHLHKLLADGRATHVDGLGRESRWKLVAQA